LNTNRSTFIRTLRQSWYTQNSLLCVGLDPDLQKIPVKFRKQPNALFQFNREIIDATASWVCAYKVQIAYYSAVSAENQLEQTIEYIQVNYPHLPVILDAKRGDIGSTAQMYSKEAFERYRADAVTVNPYMGGDTLEPFLQYVDKGVIVLCRTSNPGSGEFQELLVEDYSIAHHVAKQAATKWNTHNNVGLVVGAPYPDEIKSVRAIVGDMLLLIPGIGSQGGNLQSVVQNGLTNVKTGLLINVSRSVIYASNSLDFAESAAREAKNITLQINQYRYT